MLTLRHLTVKYGQLTALQGVDLDVQRGDIYALLGPSGCGKTTLLYTVAGLIAPSEGEIIKSKDLKSLSLIPQHYGLLPWKKAIDNVALSLAIRGYGRKEARLKARTFLEELGLGDILFKFPVQMSGGQQQRVALARSLIFEPDLLLMDEPFSALDQLTREELQEYFLRLHRAKGFSAILVTHSIEEAVFLGGHIVIMGNTPGSIKGVIHNPLDREKVRDRRMSPLFYEICREVRGCLEK